MRTSASPCFFLLAMRCSSALCVIATLVVGIVDAHAVRQYRCSGRIQFRPCGPGETETLPQAEISSAPTTPAFDPRFPITGPRYAEVVSSSLSKLSRSTGLWSGKIKGNGLIETELRIYRRGIIESRRYMGHVWLKNKATPFKITSALPAGKGWHWEIAVWAR